MSDRFYIEETRELVMVKPNGTMEFYGEEGLQSSAPLSFSGFSEAAAFAEGKGWKPLVAGVNV